MNDNIPYDPLHSAAGDDGWRRFRCTGCDAVVCTTPPINLVLLCTLCEAVYVEERLGFVKK